jgi:hypothetical protein
MVTNPPPPSPGWKKDQLSTTAHPFCADLGHLNYDVTSGLPQSGLPRHAQDYDVTSGPTTPHAPLGTTIPPATLPPLVHPTTTHAQNHRPTRLLESPRSLPRVFPKSSQSLSGVFPSVSGLKVKKFIYK